MPWPWNPVRGYLRSLKITPFDMPSIITDCRSLVAIDYLLSFLTYLISNVTLKSGSGVTQGHRNWHHSTDWLWFPIGVFIETLSIRHSVFEILFTFEKYRDRDQGSLKVIENDTIWYTAYDFVLMFHSNYGSVSCLFWDIQCRKISRP